MWTKVGDDSRVLSANQSQEEPPQCHLLGITGLLAPIAQSLMRQTVDTKGKQRQSPQQSRQGQIWVTAHTQV